MGEEERRRAGEECTRTISVGDDEGWSGEWERRRGREQEGERGGVVGEKGRRRRGSAGGGEWERKRARGSVSVDLDEGP